MEEVELKNLNPRKIKFSGNSRKEFIYKIIILGIVAIVWESYAISTKNSLIMPKFTDTMNQLGIAVIDPKVILNISITMVRVLKGFMWSLVIGIPLGFIMGLSQVANRLISGLVDSVRQVPVMAWVPLTIVWFGIGDGPTIFLIAFTGVFPVILNTIQGVKNISKDYYHAAKSMGAGRISIFKDIIIPATIPDILTGARIAISTGWMSVI